VNKQNSESNHKTSGNTCHSSECVMHDCMHYATRKLSF